jgi:hypothetical protein
VQARSNIAMCCCCVDDDALVVLRPACPRLANGCPDNIPRSKRLVHRLMHTLCGVDHDCRACCLIRLVSSVTWLYTLRRSAIRCRIFRSACMTVV